MVTNHPFRASEKVTRKWRVRFRPQDPIVDFHEDHGFLLDFDTKKMGKNPMVFEGGKSHGLKPHFSNENGYREPQHLSMSMSGSIPRNIIRHQLHLARGCLQHRWVRNMENKNI